MQQDALRIVNAPSAILGVALFGLATCRAGWTNDEQPQELTVTSPESKPLNLLLTQAELRSIIRNYEIRTGVDLTAPIEDDEILVKARGVLAPMRDVSQEVWGGVAAPFWAIMNPTQAWRIFVPIPPKGPPRESERPAPDSR